MSIVQEVAQAAMKKAIAWICRNASIARRWSAEGLRPSAVCGRVPDREPHLRGSALFYYRQRSHRRNIDRRG